MSDVWNRVVSIIKDQGLEPKGGGAITPQTSFREDLEADSLDLVELIMAFEEEFEGEIGDEEAQEIETVGEAVAYIEEHFVEAESPSQ